MNLEIEKKYLCKHGSELMLFLSHHLFFSEKIINQVYVLPEDGSEIRYRNTVSLEKIEFFKTIKKGEGLVREEIETEISFDEYVHNVDKLKDFQYLSKKRIVVLFDSKKIEIDFFHNKELNNLVLLEVEFDSVEEAEKFNSILEFDFVVRDVTEEKEFKNKNLWKKINNIS